MYLSVFTYNEEINPVMKPNHFNTFPSINVTCIETCTYVISTPTSSIGLLYLSLNLFDPSSSFCCFEPQH